LAQNYNYIEQKTFEDRKINTVKDYITQSYVKCTTMFYNALHTRAPLLLHFFPSSIHPLGPPGTTHGSSTSPSQTQNNSIGNI
jgi:hypothetical protein